MALHLAFEDRGFGRAYVAVEATLAEGERLVAKATRGAGQPVPVSVVRAPKAGVWVLIAPLLKESYPVELCVRDAAGNEREHTPYAISARGSALRLPASQFLVTGLDDIRYIDLRPTPDATWLSAERLVDAEDGSDVIHADAVVLAPEGVPVPTPALEALDLSGERLDIAPVVELDRERWTVAGERVVWRLHLSFRILRTLDHFVLSAAWDDARLAPGFFVAEPWLLEKLRWEWSRIAEDDACKGNYHKWFLENGRASDRELHVQAATPLDGPMFSVIVPCFETPRVFLEECVESVRRQTYANWELVLVNASPQNLELSEALLELASSDSRISVVTLPANLGIALNTRAGMEAATGEYLCFLDHDDFIEPNALFEYAKAIVEHPDIDLLYCDEDLWRDEQYGSGYFKPDFNLRLLLARNYITHLLCVSRRAVDELEREGRLPGREVDGAQDYALTLRISALGRRMWHVRKFLYHWRVHEASTSVSLSAKTWTDDAGARVLASYFADAGIRARVEPGIEANIYEIVYEGANDELVSVVVSRTCDDDRVVRAVEAVLSTCTYPHLEVLVTNAGEPLGEALMADPRVREVCVEGAPTPGALKNRGAREAKGRFLLFLEDRCEVSTPDFVERLLGPFAHGDVGATGAGLVYPDGLIRSVGICLPRGIPRFVNHFIPAATTDADYYRRMSWFMRDVTALSGSAMLVDAEVFFEVGGFEEDFRYGLEDVDLCLRIAERGKRSVEVPKACAVYHGWASNGRALPFSYFGQPASPTNLEDCVAIRHDEGLFRMRWSTYWGFGDPLYNPQLAMESCHYQLTYW